MRTFTTVLTLLIFLSPVHAQIRWTSLDGPWEASEPGDIAVGYGESASWVYAIGGMNRALVKSRDRGETWESLPMDHVLAVTCMLNQPMTVFAAREAGSRSILSRSTDGGGTWSDLRAFDSPVSKIAMSPAGSGVMFVGLGGRRFDVNRPLWQSVDGGTTWGQVAGFDVYARITQIMFDPSDSSLMYISTAGTMGGTWKSTDAGGSWSPRNYGLTSVQITSLVISHHPQGNLLFAGTCEETGNEPRIYRSTDEGDHWTVTVNSSGATDIVVDPVSQGTVYAATKDGVLLTHDSGSSWTLQNNGLTSKDCRRLTVLQDENQQVHLLMGTRAAFYRSDDAGQSWIERTSGMALVSCYGVAVSPAGLFSIAYGGKQSGSVVQHSPDGRKWSVMLDNTIFAPFVDSTFYGFAIACSPTDAKVVIASGTSGKDYPQVVFRSSDAGETWTKVYARDFANQLCNIMIDPRDDRFVYTADVDHILKSSDGGITWDPLPDSPPYVYSIGLAASRSRLSTTLYAGGSRQVDKSTDGGKSWFPAGTGLPSSVIALVCDPVDSQIVFAGTNHNRMYRTTNGGLDWQPCSEGLYGDFIQSLAVNPATRALYACAADYAGGSTRIYRSTNLGITWKDISGGLEDAIVFCLAVDKIGTNTIFAATSQGIFRLVDAPNITTDVRGHSSGVPDACQLDQNYPNPFNPATTIQFSIVSTQYTILRVYDLLGREVATLVNELKQPGTYSVRWDASGMASGIYQCRLQAGDVTQTSRMLLLK